MEVGGYFELEKILKSEYYSNYNMIRLNSGRAGIYHAIKCLKCKKVLLPYYLCESVKEFLEKKGIMIDCYSINDDFLPSITNINKNTALVVTNYFGLLKEHQIKNIIKNNKNVILDNTQGFYSRNLGLGEYSVYSPRKFFGVPDGAYVIGPNVNDDVDYKQDMSSKTASYLFSKIETGSNNNYYLYLENEERIHNSDIMLMSKLTRYLLSNIDYEQVANKRKENYKLAVDLFNEINELKSDYLNMDNVVPMIYPLLIRDNNARNKLLENNIYVSQWWKYLIENSKISKFERDLCKYLLPVPIDQRYGIKELKYIKKVIIDANI